MIKWLGWIGVIAVTATVGYASPPPSDIDVERVPRWEAQRVPMLAVGPDCGRAAAPADGSPFSLALRRGIQLAYASPVTVSGWQRPEAACHRFNARAKLRFHKLRWRSADEIRRSIEQTRFQQQFSYAWRYHNRYTLQRVEPGILLYGTFEQLPHLRLFVEIDLADYWRVRLENTYDLADLGIEPAWRAQMDYTF